MLPLLLLAACGTPSTSPETPSPTPVIMAITAPYGVAGQSNPITVTGAPAGASVLFFRSANGPGAGPCPAVAGGACLDIVAPNQLGEVVADAQGRAVLTKAVPRGAGGTSWLQAAIRPIGGVSGTSGVFEQQVAAITPDRDGDFLMDSEEQLLGTDPRDEDTDNDGALDGVEQRRGCDPFVADTDADGIVDGDDVDPLRRGPFDTITIQDTLVSDPQTSLPDPEFDPIGHRIVWEDDGGNEVWVADIDDATGDFVPTNGMGTRIDTNVAAISWGKNGPEWAFSDLGSQIVYTKDVNGEMMIHRAAQDAAGAWTIDVLADTEGAMSPIGSWDDGDPDPRVRFVRYEQGRYNLYWQELDSTVGGLVPQPLQFARWVPDSRKVTGVAPVNGIDQVFTYDVDSGQLAQLTSDGEDHGSVFFFKAPELGNETLFFTTHAPFPNYPDRLVVYRQRGGVWSPIKTIQMPPSFPYVVSPEVFTWQGKSYVSYLATRGRRNFDNGEAQVWLAGLAPSNNVIRRISEGDAVLRKDPEPYAEGARPWVYYSKILAGGKRVIRRCELGL